MSVKWKNGMPVSEKGKNRGIGLRNVKRAIEKYDGDMKLEDKKGMFIVDIFLNS
jgi:sensor histidine kinase YesM